MKEHLYTKIFNHYKERILSGELKAGTRLSGEFEIADEFGVSRITVSRALRDLENENLIKRVRGSGSYVSETKRQLQGTPSFISLILPYKGDFSTEILKGVEEIARKNGYFVTFHNSTESVDLEKELITDIISRGSSGLIAYPFDPKGNMDQYSKMIISGYPFVLIDRKIQGLDVPLIRADNRKASYDLTSFLIGLGHTRIIFLANKVHEISSETERYEGFCKAHIDHSVPLLHKNLYGSREDTADLRADYMPGKDQNTRYANYFFDLLEGIEPANRPTAIVSVNDQTAALLISTALERGLSIPADYSITGFDNLPYASRLAVPLTTAAQPAAEIGRLAAGELIRLIRNPGYKAETKIVETIIIKRNSTASL